MFPVINAQILLLISNTQTRPSFYCPYLQPDCHFEENILLILPAKMALMAKRMGPVICLLIMVMDIVAGILGIEAQVAQNKVCFVFHLGCVLLVLFSLILKKKKKKFRHSGSI